MGQQGLRNLMEELFEAAKSLTITDLANELGVSTSYLRKVRDGTRPMPEHWLPDLARLLRKRARHLEGLAKRLERAQP